MYKNIKKKIVKLCMQHYQEYQNERNEVIIVPEIRIQYVEKCYKSLAERANMHLSENVRKYIREYNQNLENSPTESI